MELTNELLDSVLNIAEAAGNKIMHVYQRGNVAVQTKEDASPLTEADLLAHQYIIAELSQLTPNIPVLSEESLENEIKSRGEWETFWLVDPLDGTKEFIHRTDEFTVNIALISQHVPVLGVVVAPALGVSYYGMNGFGAHKKTSESTQAISAALPIPGETYKVVASRRHGSEQLDNFLGQFENYALVNAGSSLKICLVAEGKADIYPRLGPTNEWDIAAGHAVINNANGKLYGANGKPFSYNMRDTLLNGNFVVSHEALESFL